MLTHLYNIQSHCITSLSRPLKVQMPYMPMCELYMRIFVIILRVWTLYEILLSDYVQPCLCFNGMQLKSGLEQEETRQDWQPKPAENGSFWACSLGAVGYFRKMNSKPELLDSKKKKKKKGRSQCQNSGSLFGRLCNVLLFSRKGSRSFQTTKFVTLCGCLWRQKGT